MVCALSLKHKKVIIIDNESLLFRTIIILCVNIILMTKIYCHKNYSLILHIEKLKKCQKNQKRLIL